MCGVKGVARGRWNGVHPGWPAFAQVAA